MKTDTPINLDDARDLKRLGLPLNMSVEHREFSLDYSRHWIALMNAHGSFMVAVSEYAGASPRAGSPGKWRLVQCRLAALDKAPHRCADFLDRLQDENERALMAGLIDQRAVPFIVFWADVINTVNAGTPLTINPGDVPVWVDPGE